MSLDVYLTLAGETAPVGSGIFIRVNGATEEISREEWDRRFPGREPVVCQSLPSVDEVYSRNITHNLNKMAAEAGIYAALWRPDESGFTHAQQLIAPLEQGLALLKSDPDRFRQFNPENGWGTYESLLDFVADYLHACREWPSASVEVSR